MNGLDMAVGSSGSLPSTNGTAVLMLSNGTGGFTNVPLRLSQPKSVAIGDVDNDGVGEAVFSLIYAGMGADGSVVVKSDGSVPYTINRGNGASSIAIANLDNYRDNDLDYAVANTATNDITVNFWNGAGYNTIQYSTVVQIQAITVGRVGSDTILDLVGVSGTAGVVVLEGNPVFGFASPVTYPAGTGPTGVIGGDFNRDGLYDVMVLNPGDSRASLLLASPQGGFFPPLQFDTPHQSADFVVADLDGDGRLDVAIATQGAPGVMLIYSNVDRL
jgi:hypothetical protein